MIQRLSIENLALLDSAELEFGDGFVAVTGETGAGKSVLLGALSLLAGNRADKGKIREGAQTCTVEAGIYLVDSGAVDRVLESMELPACEENTLLLRRSFSIDRIPKIQINGVSTTLARLKELGESWIDFHGPGEPQKLFHERIQLQWLDQYSLGLAATESSKASFASYSAHYAEWKSLLQQIDIVQGSERLSPDEQDFLRNQLKRLDGLELTEAAIDTLERDYQRLSSAQELLELTQQVEEGLSGEDGVDGQVSQLLRLAQQVQDLDPGSSGLADRLHAVLVELEDIGECYRDLGQSLDFDEATAESLEEQMNTWMDCKRRFGASLDMVLEEKRKLEERLAMQGDVEGTLKRLEEEKKKMEDTLFELGGDIRRTREAGGNALAGEVEVLLKRLGFKKARFRIEVVDTQEIAKTGTSRCRFLFAPNAGQSLMPLNKIASSGESARVMLALKTLLAKLDHTPVLVFDEVDANVGGEIGGEVGAELRRLGQGHQVLCVTHLPQVAAQATRHFLVEKDQDEEETQVTISELKVGSPERRLEVARMLGDRESDSALQHADSLLG